MKEIKVNIYKILVLKCLVPLPIIKVLVANGTLEYNMGLIKIIKNGTVDGGDNLSLVIAIVSVIVIMIILAITFCAVVISIYIRIKRKYSR